jgi:hypothetical protein
VFSKKYEMIASFEFRLMAPGMCPPKNSSSYLQSIMR